MLFLALVIPLIAGNVPALGGSSGLSLISRPTFVQRPTGIALYELGLLILCIMAFLSWLVRESRLGRQFSAIRPVTSWPERSE